jgi:hypothetical protein
MKERIKSICQDLEKEHHIKILFAVENGSRAWRMASKNSDYDVRFVFVRPLEEYIQLKEPADVINIAFDEDGNKCGAEGSLIDVSGFDIFKFTALLSNSNPTTIEWLVTDIVYYGRQNAVLKRFATENFNPYALYCHYRSLAKNNYNKYIEKGKNVTHKRYLQVFRGIVNAKWVVHKKTIPPISLLVALGAVGAVMPAPVVNRLKVIIDLKSKSKEKDKIGRIKEMDAFIETFLGDDREKPAERLEVDLSLLDNELRRIVLNSRPSFPA